MNRYYETGVEDFRIRFAQESDVGLILKFIKELLTMRSCSTR